MPASLITSQWTKHFCVGAKFFNLSCRVRQVGIKSAFSWQVYTWVHTCGGESGYVNEWRETCWVLDCQTKIFTLLLTEHSLGHKEWCHLQFLKKRRPTVYWEAWTFTFHERKPLVFVWTPVLTQPSPATREITERERLYKFMHLEDKPKKPKVLQIQILQGRNRHKSKG